MDEVLEGLALDTVSPECLPLLHARADVGLHLQLIYLLKLAPYLLNELCQLSLYSARIFASAQLPQPSEQCTYTVYILFYICTLRSITVGTWLPWADVLHIFCLVYYFIWAYGALLFFLRRVLMCSWLRPQPGYAVTRSFPPFCMRSWRY